MWYGFVSYIDDSFIKSIIFVYHKYGVALIFCQVLLVSINLSLG